MNKKWLYPITILLAIAFLLVANRCITGQLSIYDNYVGTDSYKATVTKIVSSVQNNYTLGGTENMTETIIIFRATISSGQHRGESVLCTQQIDPLYASQPDPVKEGDGILIFEDTSGMYNTPYIMMEYLRTDGLSLLGIVFLALLLLFGRFKGFNTILSLVFTCLALFAVFIPAVLAGQNIYLWTVIICLFVIATTLSIVSGYNRKSLAAFIGCFAGVLSSGLLTAVMDKVLRLTGLVDEQAIYLTMLDTGSPLNLHAILFAAITIGAMGAIMDVAMSIAASLHEVYDKTHCSSRELFGSGMTIGRDMMGTMSNTLILAYIGSSLSLTLLLTAYNRSLIQLLNREAIVVEVLQALVGSIGILLTIPLTSLICAWLYARRLHERPTILQDGEAPVPKKEEAFPICEVSTPEVEEMLPTCEDHTPEENLPTEKVEPPAPYERILSEDYSFEEYQRMLQESSPTDQPAQKKDDLSQ